ncbi:HNH endonuclease signature motif containing protein [Negativibacillus massiliensis]|nr:HNH endonuclease signature motif containing protein [Negativibacillus massiliensis]
MKFDYKSKKWKKKRKKILKRDGYKCQICKRFGRQRQATIVHHIEHADQCPELAFTDSNLISVCANCHNTLHPEKSKQAHRGYSVE